MTQSTDGAQRSTIIFPTSDGDHSASRSHLLCVRNIYIDDVIIYAKTEAEFLERMELVFQRCRKHKLTFNPEKVRLGMSRVEYVGHVIDDTGLSFTREKISEVADFPKPMTAKTLMSFIGLAWVFSKTYT